MNYAFAGDRQISCNILKRLMNKGYNPKYLLVTDGIGSTHAKELIKISKLSEDKIFIGSNVIKDQAKLALLKKENLDYIIGIHYPYIIPSQLLNLPKVGFLNLHPAFLPYNKGWHTPSWAIIDKSPYGATLHFMSEELDKGDIIHQKKIKVDTFDTANTIYQKVLKLEEEVFFEALGELLTLNPNRIVQREEGTSYKKSDIEKERLIDLNHIDKTSNLLDKLRALTTNDINEAAFYVENGKKIGVRVVFEEID